MSKKCIGKCALCRKECDLTFEHIPPRAAFNTTPAKPVSGDFLLSDNDRMPWDISGLPYDNQQKGMGRYSLCSSCNNNTGAWYGDSYNEIAHIVHQVVTNPSVSKNVGIEIREVYPLRFVKQILSMFCSINNFDDPRINILRAFVLNKDAVGIDKILYKLCMYFTNSTMMKYAPLSVEIRESGNCYESMALSEITAYPLGFILYFNPTDTWHYDGIDITEFANCKYDDCCNIELPICLKEVNDIFPTDYRSKEEIEQCIQENKKWREKHEHL